MRVQVVLGVTILIILLVALSCFLLVIVLKILAVPENQKTVKEQKKEDRQDKKVIRINSEEFSENIEEDVKNARQMILGYIPKIHTAIWRIETTSDISRFLNYWDKLTRYYEDIKEVCSIADIEHVPDLKNEVEKIFNILNRRKQLIRNCIMKSFNPTYKFVENFYNIYLENIKRDYAIYPTAQQRVNWWNAKVQENKDKYDEETLEFVEKLSRDLESKLEEAEQMKLMSPLQGNHWTYSMNAMYSIDSMSGVEFENWCAKLLLSVGYTDVRITQGSGDQGVDIIASKDSLTYAIQCKCYSSNLGNKPVQEVCAGRIYYSCDVAAVMTNRYFTHSAQELAIKTDVLLWDRDVLQSMLLESSE